jgi:hypothetical protein
MKYIEELVSGDCFVYENQYFLLTSDFKKNGKKLCYSLQDGFAKWFENNDIVDHEQMYCLDKDNNVVAIKPTKANSAS